jgi:hypothetical protein
VPRVVAGAKKRTPVSTADPEQASEILSEVYYPLRLLQLDQTKEFTFEMTAVDLGPLTLGRLTSGTDRRLTSGTDISLDCGDLETA